MSVHLILMKTPAGVDAPEEMEEELEVLGSREDVAARLASVFPSAEVLGGKVLVRTAAWSARFQLEEEPVAALPVSLSGGSGALAEVLAAAGALGWTLLDPESGRTLDPAADPAAAWQQLCADQGVPPSASGADGDTTWHGTH
jgi:hypothetical protein